MKNILFVILVIFGIHQLAFAELNVTQVKGNKVLANFDGQELQSNGIFEILNENFQIVAKIKVLKIQKQKGLLQLISGKLEVGNKYSIQKAKSQDIDQQSKAEVFTSNNRETEVTNDFKKLFSVQAFYLTGDAKIQLANGFGGSDIEADLTGFSVGADYTYWLDNFALGADFRYSVTTIDGTSSQDASSSELGVFAGYLIPDLNFKFYGGFYFYGTIETKEAVGANSFSANETTGFRLGGQYYLTPTFSVIGEYRILVSQVDGNEALVLKDIELTTFSIGAGFHF